MRMRNQERTGKKQGRTDMLKSEVGGGTQDESQVAGTEYRRDDSAVHRNNG